MFATRMRQLRFGFGVVIVLAQYDNNYVVAK